MHEFTFTDGKSGEWRICNFNGGGSAPSRRSCPSWSAYDGSFFLFGGFNGVDRLNDMWKLTPQSEEIGFHKWSLIRPLGGTPPTPRYFHSSVVFRDSLFICCGYSGQERLNDLHVFDFNTLTWAQVISEGVPPGRSSLLAAVYDRSLLLGFGYDGHHVLNDLYEYTLDPVLLPPSSFKQDVTKLLTDEAFTDVEFRVVDDQSDSLSLRANRSYLGARSAHFRAMLFSSGMRECSHKSPIEIRGVDGETFRSVLEFLYTDELPEATEAAVVKLLIAAEMFMVDRLKGLCEDWLRRKLRLDNAVDLLLTANTHNASGLRTLCLEFIVAHEDSIKTQHPQSLKQLIREPDLLYEILLKRRPSVSGGTSDLVISAQRLHTQAAGPNTNITR
jgi:hypothetical protein